MTMKGWLGWLIGFSLGCGLASPTAFAQHTIVLRDLTLIRNVTIADVETDGLRVSDNGVLRLVLWCDLLKVATGDAHVDEARQAAVNQSIQQIGLPWYRIRERLRIGDFASLQPTADRLRDQVKNVPGLAMYFACAGQFHAALDDGNRIAAVEPLLQIMRIRRQSPTPMAEYDAAAKLRFDDTGICLNLLPVWFDTDDAELEKLIGRITSEPELVELPAGFYYHSLLIAHDKSKQVPAADPRYGDWTSRLSAQLAFLNNQPGDLATADSIEHLPHGTASHAIAVYYHGLAQMRLTSSATPPSHPTQWAITLLQIPASYGDRFPELSAAAIFHVLQSLDGDAVGRESLSRELGEKYARTHFGKRYLRETANQR